MAASRGTLLEVFRPAEVVVAASTGRALLTELESRNHSHQQPRHSQWKAEETVDSGAHLKNRTPHAVTMVTKIRKTAAEVTEPEEEVGVEVHRIPMVDN